ncbi:hypothetical protein ACA910_019029 [Epithemia clementina (nom. ined.)]
MSRLSSSAIDLTVVATSTAAFMYLSWNIFDTELDCFPSRRELEQSLPRLLIHVPPDDTTKKILCICHEWKDEDSSDHHNKIWKYVKKRRWILAKQFDGLYHDFSCTDWGAGTQTKTEYYELRSRHKLEHLTIFLRQCYVLVVDSYHGFSRSNDWMIWECLLATKTCRIVVNEKIISFLKEHGSNPSFSALQSRLRHAMIPDIHIKRSLLEQSRALTFDSAEYVLLPVDLVINSKDWETIEPEPLSLQQMPSDRSKILMISHRWETATHPDPHHWKLRMIQKFLQDQKSQNIIGNNYHQYYEYVFFYWKCINSKFMLSKYLRSSHQTTAGIDEDIIHSRLKQDFLIRMNQLYAKCPCLCLCDEEYFQRSWCLLELCINQLNAPGNRKPVILMMTNDDIDGGSQDKRSCLIRPNLNDRGIEKDLDKKYLSHDCTLEQDKKHPLLAWLDGVFVLQYMNYLHSLTRNEYPVLFSGEGQAKLVLKLPSNFEHLQVQLRTLIKQSKRSVSTDLPLLFHLMDTLIIPVA